MSLSTDTSEWDQKRYNVIREAVAHIIRRIDGGHEGKRCCFGDFVIPINTIAGISGSDVMELITEDDITKAFRNGGTKEYAVECNKICINLDGVLHVRVGPQIGSSKTSRTRVYDLCLVKDMARAEIEADNAKSNASIINPNRFSRSSGADFTLPDDVKQRLITFARDTKDKLVTNRKRRKSAEAERQKEKEIKDEKASALKKIKKRNEEKDTMKHIQSLRKQLANQFDMLKNAHNELRKKMDEETLARNYYYSLKNEYDITQQALEAAGIKENEYNQTTIQPGTKNDQKGCDDTTDTKYCLHYFYRGKVGMMELCSNTGYGFTERDLMKGIQEDFQEDGDDNGIEVLINNGDNDANGVGDRDTEEDGTMVKTLNKLHNLVLTKVGKLSCWVPSTHVLVHKNRIGAIQKNEEIMSNLASLFSKEKCTWNADARRIFTSFSSFGYGCSDEGTIFIMAGTLLAVFGQVGINIGGEQIGRALPSRATLSNWEVDTAVDCLFGECGDMKHAGVTRFGITTDHGHRKGQGHLVKLLSYPTNKDDGSLTISHLCLNVDSAGHSAEEASDAIAESVSFYTDILREQNNGEDVELSVITGDSGGGASVQQLHPKLIEKKVMCKSSKKLSCDLHNMNKALEVACIDTWGKQGIGHRTPFQMYWLWNRIYKLSRKDLGREGMNEAWYITIKNLRSSRKWQTAAINKCRHAFEDFMKRLQDLEEGDDDDLALAIQLVTKAPTDVKDPVFSRWESVTPSIRLFAEYWIVIYFFVRTIAQMEKSGSYLKTLSCTILSLMHNSKMPSNAGDNIDTFVKQHEEDDSILSEEPLTEDSTPIFLVVTHFLDGFNRSYFHDMFQFLKISDPYLGDGTFGQIARFGPERCAVMHLRLLDLENGGVETEKEFSRYRETYEKSDAEVRKFLDTATTVFLQRFRFIFDKHMVKKWTTTETLHYILGGDPYHAREFARWLVHHKANEDLKNDMTITTMQTRSNPSTPSSINCTPSTSPSKKLTSNFHNGEIQFSFEKKVVTLGRHHTMTHGDVKVDLHESMNFLTENADPLVILDDPFVTENWAHINSLANEKVAVDIWATTSPTNEKYAPFVLNVIHWICIHANHQQRCENYVQLCGLLALTGVGEVRRTCRAIMNSVINRRFNLWVIQKTNQRRQASSEKMVKRLQGYEKVALFAEFVKGFFAKVERTMGSKELWKDIRMRLETATDKASNCERLERLQKFTKCAEKNPKYVKAQRAMGIELTPRTAKAVSLRVLVGVNNSYLKGARFTIEDAVNDELKARGIKLLHDPKKVSSLQSKRQAIRKHEWLRRVAAGQQDLRELEVDSILPLSARMKHFLDSYHAVILDGEKATDELDIDDE